MAARLLKIRTEKEEQALREKHLRQALGDRTMQELSEITTNWNLRHATDPGGNITPLTMVAILVYMEHDTRFPEKHAQVEQL